MKQSRLSRILRKSLLPLASLLALTGCGPSSEEAQRCGGEFVAVLTGGLSCIGRSGTSSPPPPPPPPQPAEPPPRTVVINGFDEYEPNSTFDNANPVSFLDAEVDQSAGIEILGNVGASNDNADFFVFTPTRTDFFAVYLCGETCLEHPVTDDVYIAIYDQSQTTIASTPIGTDAEQFVGAELTAGMAYYIEINGYGTGEDGMDYKLVVID